MNCEINALSAIFPVHWAKKITLNYSSSAQIIKIHQFPHCASVIMWTLVELNYILIFPVFSDNALRYRSAAMMRLDFLRPLRDFQSFENHCLCHFL